MASSGALAMPASCPWCQLDLPTSWEPPPCSENLPIAPSHPHPHCTPVPCCLAAWPPGLKRVAALQRILATAVARRSSTQPLRSSRSWATRWDICTSRCREGRRASKTRRPRSSSCVRSCAKRARQRATRLGCPHGCAVLMASVASNGCVSVSTMYAFVSCVHEVHSWAERVRCVECCAPAETACVGYEAAREVAWCVFSTRNI